MLRAGFCPVTLLISSANIFATFFTTTASDEDMQTGVASCGVAIAKAPLTDLFKISMSAMTGVAETMAKDMRTIVFKDFISVACFSMKFRK